ncbi:type II secretion system minor pseudopilin GspI [Catenovulum sediminis]|uniref:Type II secretion system protein I n=1 Tax=Catenovulum sediminis TaxID=1740262 RepID=A0ABV1RI33_9ALTE|nr:type II secretion system minor pseudopilin GspI [Catenovulum sediminis]
MKRFKSINRQISGFTILEVIVAMAILATAGVAVVQSASVHINNQTRLQQHMFAGWVASNRLNELLIEKKWPVEKGKKGEMELAGQEWFWQQKVLKTAFGEDLVAVKIEVFSDANYENYITEQITYLSKP